jgi:hypothetical protein
MKRRWSLFAGLSAILGALVLMPVASIELGCAAIPVTAVTVASPVPVGQRRAEARTWLTYPEWHIVYSAESLGRPPRAR